MCLKHGAPRAKSEALYLGCPSNSDTALVFYEDARTLLLEGVALPSRALAAKPPADPTNHGGSDQSLFHSDAQAGFSFRETLRGQINVVPMQF